MTPVFLDTVGLLAVWDESDQWHADADRVYRQLISTARPLLTTTQLLLECGNAAARRPYRTRVPVLRDALNDLGWLVEATNTEIDEAWRRYGASGAGEAGIVDLISMTVMTRLGVREVFSNNRHFRSGGFVTLF